MIKEQEQKILKRCTELLKKAKAKNSQHHITMFSKYIDALPTLDDEAIMPITEAIDFYEAELNAI